MSKTYLSLLFLFLLLCQSCAIFNSGTAHIKYTHIKAKFDHIPYENKEKLGSLSFSVRNVQHPSLYPRYATTLSLDPSVHFDRQRFTTERTRLSAEGIEENYPEVRITRFSGFGNIKWTTHTPIGQFVLSGGLGVGANKIENSRELSSFRTRAIRKLDFHYIGFITDRIFLLFGPRIYKDQKEEAIFAFRIGYFWGAKENETGFLELIRVPRQMPVQIDVDQTPESSESDQD